MAENKKSFVLYVDLIHTVEELTDTQAGRLLKHVLRYVNDKNPEAPDKVTKLVFEPIKQQLKRDLVKWELEKVDRSKAGKKGGIESGKVRRDKKKQKEANEASALKSKQTEANEAVSVNVSVTDSERENTAPALKNGSEVFYTIEHCALVAMQDERFVRANKTNPKELQDFNSHLEKRATYEKNPADYKRHFASWKGAGKKEVSQQDQLTSPKLKQL